MMLNLLITSLLVASSTALQCIHNATILDELCQKGVLVSGGSYSREFGVLDCSKNLDRCVSFKTMDIAFFKTLDVSKDGNPLSRSIVSSEGKVMGRLCMSQADTDKIQAQKADSCTGKTEKSCYCTTDKCTGNSEGAVMTMVSLLAVVAYSVFQ